MKNIRMCVEHAEGDLWVLVPDEGEDVFVLPKERFSLSVNDIVDCEVEGNEILSLTVVPGEKEKRLKHNSDLLSALFAKGKK